MNNYLKQKRTSSNKNHKLNDLIKQNPEIDTLMRNPENIIHMNFSDLKKIIKSN
tara:strand:- start:3642 stop:3803 length:162 start_codon:yes stop_codon:yes gene_type:complete